MKVTVCFGTVNVIVPCGNGELYVSDLIERAISRYRKATNKHSDEPVEVHNLETIDDHGILDPEDTVCEVVDDKDKLIAIFDEDHLSKRRLHNGGDGTSASSTGTASPDVFQGEDSCASSLQDELSPRIFTPIKDSCKELINQKITSPGSKQGTPPPVPPKPNRRPGQLSPARISSLETRLSEDSGISHEDGNDSVGTNLSSPRSINIVRTDPPPVSRFWSRPSETVFAAIGTPIKTSVKHVPEPVKRVPEMVNHLPETVDNDIRTHSTSSEYDNHSDEGLFTLGRNSTRKSMFADNPIMDRWAAKQEEILFQQQENRQEPAGQATSPSAEEKNFPQSRGLTSRAADASNFHEDKVNGKHEEDTHSLTSLSSSESEPEMSVIELEPLPGEGLGLSVGGYRTADGRELGLIVQDISPDGCAARDGRLEIADRIGMINGQNIMDVPNDRAEQIFHSMVGHAPVMQLAISRMHTFIPGPDKQDTFKESQTQPSYANSEVNGTMHLDAEVDCAPVNGHGGTVQLNDEVQVPQMNGPNRVVQVMNEQVVLRSKQIRPGSRGVPSVLPGLTMKKVNKRYLLELQKGSDGLGFSITTRDNPAGGYAPIFIKSILAKGAAISDGRLKSGDQLVEVNGVKLTGKSQGEAVNVLRSTKGLVKLLVQREETLLEGGKPAIEVNEENTAQLRREGNEVLKLKIPLNVSGAAGLGVSVKGKSSATEEEGRDSPQDKGIFVKSVISGGAAQKDGRLKPDDQLLSVNGMSLMGLTNSDAMETLRDAMQGARPGQAFIDVTIARRKDLDVEPGALYASKSLEDLNAPDQERSIEAGPSKAPKPKVPERKVSDGGKILANVIRVHTVTVEEGEGDSEEDNFTTEPLNLSPIKHRNFVKRNESYCHAVDRTMSPNMIPTPYGNRHTGRVISPLASRRETLGQSTRESPIAETAATMASSPRSDRAIITRLDDEPSTSTPRAVYPTSTVAHPTPPIGSTSDSVHSRAGPPQVPSRKDSAQDVRGNYVISPQLSAGTVPIAGYASQSDQDKFRMKTRPSPLAVPPSPTQPRPSSPPPPSYETVMSRRESQPNTPSSPGSMLDQSSFSWDTDYTDSAALSPLEADGVKNPFDRDAIGRQSMSEKRGRAALDAKQTTFFVNRERLKEDKVQQLNSSPSRGKSLSEPELSIHSVREVRAPRPMLLRADSERSVLSGSRTGYPESESDKERDMRKVASTGSIIDDRTSQGRNSQRRGEVNLSFRSAVESANKEYSQRNGRYIPNGHSASQEDVQDEVPITMTSYSNFNSVQQKLAKKPFYKKGIFKMGKGRRGEYSLTDVENSSPSKVNATKETLIDFSSEQRYRQLVQQYENHSEPEYDLSDRPKTLPSRGRKKHLAKLEPQTQEALPRVGRVTVSQPTKIRRFHSAGSDSRWRIRQLP